MSEFVLDFFEGKNLATIEKKKHSYLMIDGHDQADIYILKLLFCKWVVSDKLLQAVI